MAAHSADYSDECLGVRLAAHSVVCWVASMGVMWVAMMDKH